MSNFIYYEKLQDYEEQVRKAKEYDKLQQELQRKDNIINDLKSSIADYQEVVGDYQDEIVRKDNEIKQLREDIVNHIKIASEYKEQMIIKDNNWNELKKWVENMIFNKVGSSVDVAIENHAYCKILDKIEELESGK